MGVRTLSSSRPSTSETHRLCAEGVYPSQLFTLERTFYCASGCLLLYAAKISDTFRRPSLWRAAPFPNLPANPPGFESRMDKGTHSGEDRLGRPNTQTPWQDTYQGV